MKVCLSVLVAAKSFCSAMIGACTKWTNFDYEGFVLSAEVSVVSLQNLVFPATTNIPN